MRQSTEPIAVRHGVSRIRALSPLLAATISLSLWINPERSAAAPADDLAQGLALLDRGKRTEAAPFLESAQKDPRIAPWALLAYAQLLRAEEKFSDAAVLLRKVPESASAYPDAQLALADLAQDKKLPKDIPAPKSAAIERFTSLRGRGDLKNRVLFLRAREQLAEGRQGNAREILDEIRRDAPRSDLARKSRELIRSFTPARSRTPEEAIAEAEQLVREDEAVLALELIRSAKSTVKAKTVPEYKLLASEAAALKSNGRTAEANTIYERLAKEAPLGIGDDALLALVNSAWNKNDYPRAFSLIETFRKQFPGSTNRDEIDRIEARLYDEKQENEKASALYRRLGEKGSSELVRSQALRALGWIELRERDLPRAAVDFVAAAEQAKKGIDELVTPAKQTRGTDTLRPALNPRSNHRELRDLMYERAHSLYWGAAAVSNVARSDKSTKELPSAESLLQTLSDEQPRSYYTVLARTKKASPPPERPARTERCEIEVSSELEDLLRTYFRAELRSYAEYEIGTYFAANHIELQRRVNDPSNTGPYDRAELDYLLTRARLQIDFGSPLKGVSLADSLLTKPKVLEPFAFDPSPCMARMEELAFPLNHLSAFRAASEQSGVPVTLILAIARTESHFDPRARSPKDARGLMQLLVSTAQEEGLKPGQDLFDPAVNIALGAKHLGRLRSIFNGVDQLAIAAYNAGRPAVYRWRDRHPELDLTAWTEMIAYKETRDYVKKVLVAKSIYDSRLKTER